MVTLNIGDHVGPFVLLERLGEGGFAEVWKAERADDPGHVEAIKVPNDPEYVKQLRTEDRLRKGLDHPNIVRLLGEDLDCDPPYLRMEYIPGESLEGVLQKNGSLPVKDALDIAEQVGKALAYAHEQGVIHADVKPSNVLIDPDGVARLTDFGLGLMPRDLARSVLKSQAELSNARSRSIVGTLDYMAPEQRAGEPIDARADLYALGRVLYRMLTGSLPTGLRLPSEANASVPVALDSLVARLLELKDARTATASQFLRELAIAHQDPGAEWTRALQRRVRRGRFAVGCGFMALVVVLYSPVPWVRGLFPLMGMMTAGSLIGTVLVWVKYRRSRTLRGR